MNFKDTLNLPRTDFPIRPQAAIDDPVLVARWAADDLYIKAYNLHDGAVKFILHDGPPYANGHIHLGHAYNKILKDIITKSRRMAGMHVPVIPGWDCHGLPIELKVSQQPELAHATPAEIKKACRAYAAGWIDVQREEFKRLGVVMEWQKPYITMDPAYEGTIIKAFAEFVRQGFIERKNKTVAWCPSCQTTLASAEIEYRDRKDPSLYVRFPLDADTARRLFPDIAQEISVLVWTTTPWTLPLNRGVMAHPDAEYQLVDINGTVLMVGKNVAQKLAALVQGEARVLQTFGAELLRGVRVQHPFIEKFSVPIIFDHSVGLDDGTAFVHTAPGCGPIDYEVGVKNGLEIFSPISADGKYQAGIQPAELEGMSVTDGQIWVIKKVAALGTLWHKASLMHSYPHCWRCHSGLIFRATPQWFVDLQQHDMKKRALEAIETIRFLPERAQNFLKATVENRWEWCVSRQRVWGVPIPALICRTCDAVVTSAEFMEQVAEHVAREGVEYWDTVSVDTLAQLTSPCTTCDKKYFVKEDDILDVWFDSGISHYAVLFGNPEQAFPADMYVEGVDQHRGWFQSSLLTSLVLEQRASMKAIVSHGYTVDEKGRKMSKSLGNGVDPQQVIDQLGTDGLRLWAASISNEGDIVVSDTVLKNVAEVYRKIRNTCRFLLQNLYDFDSERDRVPLDALLPIDVYALHRLHEVDAQIRAAYDAYHTAGVFHVFADYCASDLSSFYLDIVKDRLYVEQADGLARRSAQTVLWHILDTLTRAMAPVLSFTAELLSDAYQKNKRDSIHLQTFAQVPAVSIHVAVWEDLKRVRSIVLKAIEDQREQGIIKHSLEAQVHLTLPEQLLGFDEQFFKEFFIVSQVTLQMGPELQVTVQHADGQKCPRCWNWDTVVNEQGLCRRCVRVVGSIRAT